ncbi:MAG: type II toxin-antitoxin system RelE/ParE family toxin [Coriobacteriales bacterium]|jgi:mRNA interferase RelE/StbE|nr:type II toxin-antitoxin system RelE/ParE family toxin [Coriobacteriales bacterium]
MSWTLRLSSKAIKQLSKIDRPQRAILVGWLEKHIEGAANPRAHGKPLTAGHTGQWRYRIGNYRVLCEIHDDTLVVIALEVGHRKNIYN